MRSWPDAPAFDVLADARQSLLRSRTSFPAVNSAPVILPGGAHAPLVLTCEHASAYVPGEYADLGLTPADLRDHIGWDIGAAVVTTELARRLDVPAVLSGASRLLVDCNRGHADCDLIPHESHGVVIPGNANLSVEERARRLARFYDPYHAAIDATLAQHRGAMLLSVHSFTPRLNGRERAFDVGVLFDAFVDFAELLAAEIATVGYRVRLNEPYSGLDGLIHSARCHGQRHGVRYLELEINNGLLREYDAARAVAARLVSPVRTLLASTAALIARQSQGGSRCVSS